jgi:hypothetical protein
MLGLARDIWVKTPGGPKEATPMKEKYWLDDGIQKILFSFQQHYNVKWGGHINLGSAEPSYAKGGRIVPGVTGYEKHGGNIFCYEGQHFELRTDDTYNNLHPDVIAALKASNVTNVRVYSQRKALYLGIAKDFGVA